MAHSAGGVVYDTAHRSTVVVDLAGSYPGGYMIASLHGDHWVRGIQWSGTDTTSDAYPSPRSYPGIGYDQAHKQTVIFGGADSTTGTNRHYFGDTWTWNGSRLRAAATAGPSPRYGAQLVYDPKIHRLVLFGGVDLKTGNPGASFQNATVQDDYPSDTWTWNGARWTKLASQGPPGRVHANIVYDEATRELVLTGGLQETTDSSGYLTETAFGDTWTFNGKRWVRHSSQLPPREYGAMVYDAGHKRMVLFGGDNGQTGDRVNYLADTWTWNGRSWSQQNSSIGPGAGPGPRSGAGMAYDADTNRTLLFGGRTGNYLGDTWAFNGSSWKRLSAGGGVDEPKARFDPMMTYDPAHHQVVMFGGTGYYQFTGGYGPRPAGDTWVWRGGRWVEVAGPDVAMKNFVYDAANHTVVGFGGYDGDRAFAGDGPGPGTTYVWDGHAWSTPHLAHQPVGRVDANLVYDPQLRAVVMFGGYHQASGKYIYLNDTWLWDGRRWQQLKTQNKAAPSPRSKASVVYDAASHQVVLFGGVSFTAAGTCCVHVNDTWVFDRSGWKQMDAGGPAGRGPSLRADPSIAYDAARKRVILFGGQSETADDDVTISLGSLAQPKLNDTWLWDGKHWSEAPLATQAAAPSPRSEAALVYDAARKVTVMFGGYNYARIGTSCSACNTWAWNGKQWTQVSATAPNVQGFGVTQNFSEPAVYDAATREVIAVTPPVLANCGAVPEPGCQGQPSTTWLWDGKTWHQQSSPALTNSDVGGPLV